MKSAFIFLKDKKCWEAIDNEKKKLKQLKWSNIIKNAVMLNA